MTKLKTRAVAATIVLGTLIAGISPAFADTTTDTQTSQTSSSQDSVSTQSTNATDLTASSSTGTDSTQTTTSNDSSATTSTDSATSDTTDGPPAQSTEGSTSTPTASDSSTTDGSTASQATSGPSSTDGSTSTMSGNGTESTGNAGNATTLDTSDTSTDRYGDQSGYGYDNGFDFGFGYGSGADYGYGDGDGQGHHGHYHHGDDNGNNQDTVYQAQQQIQAMLNVEVLQFVQTTINEYQRAVQNGDMQTATSTLQNAENIISTVLTLEQNNNLTTVPNLSGLLSTSQTAQPQVQAQPSVKVTNAQMASLTSQGLNVVTLAKSFATASTPTARAQVLSGVSSHLSQLKTQVTQLQKTAKPHKPATSVKVKSRRKVNVHQSQHSHKILKRHGHSR